MAKALQLFDPPYEESCRLSYLGFQNIYTAGNLSRIDVASNGYWESFRSSSAFCNTDCMSVGNENLCFSL